MTQDEAYERLNVEEDLIPSGLSNRPGIPIQPSYITVHNTANAARGADARMHAIYLKGADARQRQVSWHFTVDDKRCIKHLPTKEKAWHAGPGNSKSIGIEICEHKGIDMDAAIDRASLLTAVLMFALDIPRERVVPHQFWTGKDCPHVVLRNQGGFDAFRDRADEYLEELQAVPVEEVAAASAMQDIAISAPVRSAFSALADQHVASTAKTSRAPDRLSFGMALRGTEAERMAQLERLVGRLTLENQQLREALLDARDNFREAD